MRVSLSDKGLLTPANWAVIFLGHQPELLCGVAGWDRQDLLDNLQLLAKSPRARRPAMGIHSAPRKEIKR